MKKILIALIFILSIVAISCQAINTNPQKTGSENNSGDTNTSDNSPNTNPNLYVNMGSSGNKWTTDITDNFNGTSYSIVFQGDYITQYKDSLTYSIVSAKTTNNDTDFSKYFTLDKKSGREVGKVNFTIDRSITSAINVGNEITVDIKIQAKTSNDETTTCSFLLRLVRRNQ